MYIESPVNIEQWTLLLVARAAAGATPATGMSGFGFGWIGAFAATLDLIEEQVESKPPLVGILLHDHAGIGLVSTDIPP